MQPGGELTFYVVAGEPSGDAYAAALAEALRRRRPDATFAGRGGPKLRAAAGPGIVDWCDQAAVLGLWEVLRRYGWFRAQFHRVRREVARRRPAGVILVDYPGFNLRLAAALRRDGYRGKLVYYISPQVWAWNRGRIPRMARWLDLMICIFPFEPAYYAPHGLKTLFVGHPLLNQLARETMAGPRDPHLVGLFPGSRRREVRALLPTLLRTAARLRAQRPGLRFAVAVASEKLRADVDRIRAAEVPGWTEEECALPVGRSRWLMQRAAAGLVASGTATVEAAFYRLPFALVYRVAPLTWWVGRAVVRVPYLGMVNLLAGRLVVREFLQGAARPAALSREVLRLLDDPSARAEQLRDLGEVVSRLGTVDPAVDRVSLNAAEAIVELLPTPPARAGELTRG